MRRSAFTHMKECLKIIENLRGNIIRLSTLTTKPYKTAFGEYAIQMQENSVQFNTFGNKT